MDRAPPVAVLPDNRRAARVFLAMGTQWEIVQGVGYSRLIYEALDRPMRCAGVGPDDEAQVFEALQLMEAEVLKRQSAKRKR